MKLGLTFFLLLVGSISYGQIVTIPDANFKNALVNEFTIDFDGDGDADGDADTNNDGEIQQSEAEAALGVIVIGRFVDSFVGIESFVNIVSVNVNNNNATELDLSSNINLTSIRCIDNDLVTLVLPNSSTLESLECAVNELVTIDLSQSVNLNYIDIDGNNLIELDVTNNIDLIYLDCDFNEISELDVSQNSILEILDVEFNNLSFLDVSNNPNLRYLDCTFNELDNVILENDNLEIVRLDYNLLTTINLSQCPGVSGFSCSNNPNLANLDISNGTIMDFDNIIVDDNPNLFCIQVDDVAYANAQLPVTGWRKDPWASYSKFCTLGIENDRSLITISLIPNPVQKFLTITSDFPIDEIQVYSLSGSLVYESHESVVNLSHLKSGIYFSLISIDGKVITKKFVKE